MLTPATPNIVDAMVVPLDRILTVTYCSVGATLMVTLAVIIVDVIEIGVTGIVPWLLVMLSVMPLLKLVPVMAIVRVVACTMPTGEMEVIVAAAGVDPPPPPPPPHEASASVASPMVNRCRLEKCELL